MLLLSSCVSKKQNIKVDLSKIDSLICSIQLIDKDTSNLVLDTVSSSVISEPVKDEKKSNPVDKNSLTTEISQKSVKIKYKTNTNIIKKETNDIKLGHVVYQTPDTMIVLVESSVIVRISKGKLDTNQIQQDLNGVINVVPINVTNKMEVKLVDPSPENGPSFNIRSVNKTEQIIEDEVYTQWDFTVVPLKTGYKELKLVVSIIKDGEVKEQTWSDIIRVKNNVSQKALSFWEKYWQWLLTTIIIPLIIFFYKKREDKNKKD